MSPVSTISPTFLKKEELSIEEDKFNTQVSWIAMHDCTWSSHDPESYPAEVWHLSWVCGGRAGAKLWVQLTKILPSLCHRKIIEKCFLCWCWVSVWYKRTYTHMHTHVYTYICTNIYDYIFMHNGIMHNTHVEGDTFCEILLETAFVHLK